MARNERNRTHSGEQLARQEENKKNEAMDQCKNNRMAEKKREARKNGQTELYKQLKKEIKSKIKEDKRLWLENECEKIQEFDRNNQSKLLSEKIKTVKNRVFQPKQLAIKDHQGATLIDPDKIMDRWKEYGEKLFDSPSASNSPLPSPQEDIVTDPPPPLYDQKLNMH